MTAFVRATAGISRYWLCILAIAAFLGWVPACTGAQDDAPLGWKTYQHNRDRERSAGCAERPNFAFDVPSSWELRESDCDSVAFDARNDPAELQVVVLDLPHYPGSAEAALAQMQNQWSRQVNIAEGSVQQVEHHGLPAVFRVHTEPASPSVSCESYVYALGVPARSWASHGQRAVIVAAARCADAYDQNAVIQAILDSFRLVEPY